jgi:hypothetical protein
MMTTTVTPVTHDRSQFRVLIQQIARHLHHRHLHTINIRLVMVRTEHGLILSKTFALIKYKSYRIPKLKKAVMSGLRINTFFIHFVLLLGIFTAGILPTTASNMGLHLKLEQQQQTLAAAAVTNQYPLSSMAAAAAAAAAANLAHNQVNHHSQMKVTEFLTPPFTLLLRFFTTSFTLF